MKSRTVKQWLAIAGALLLALLLWGGLSTAVAFAQDPQPGPPAGGRGRGGMMGHHVPTAVSTTVPYQGRGPEVMHSPRWQEASPTEFITGTATHDYHDYGKGMMGPHGMDRWGQGPVMGHGMMQGWGHGAMMSGADHAWTTCPGAMGLVSAAMEMTVTPDQARSLAQEYLETNVPNASIGEGADTFHGFYMFQILQDDQISGFISVNGYTGQVWVQP